MIISFRQGIVQYEQTGFLTVTPSYVSLVVLGTPTVVTVSHGISNYLHVEQESVSQAWGPITPGVDQWLYWDINTLTANRTFGITRLSPVTSPVAPASPANDQHWFDSINRVMKVWTGNHWTEKLRVFACKLVNGTIATSVSTQAPLFTGSQVGITESTAAGQIMFDTISNKPLKVGNRFITTEDILSVKTLSKSDIKVAATITEAEAQQSLSAYTVVTFSDFGKVVHATSSTVNANIPRGIIQQDVVPNTTVYVVTEGTVTSEFWDWGVAGINAPLYCDDSGSLVVTPLYPDQLPVAYVIDRRTIVLANISTVQEVGDSGVTTLGGLTDVTLTSPQINQTLVFNGNDWVNVTPTTTATNLNALTDVTLTSPATDQYLKFNGSQWINSVLPTPITSLTALTDVDIDTPTITQVLTFDGTDWVNGDLPIGMTQEFIAVADQVLFGPLSQPYVPGAGQLSVYINGIKQYPSTFTESSSTTFTVSSPSRLNDVVLAEISEINPNLIPSITQLNDMNDVVAPLPISGDVLTFDGNTWVNAVIPPTAVKWNSTDDNLFGPMSTLLGSNNIVFGSGALSAVTTGDENIVLGRLAGTSIVTGSNNVIIGGYAGVADVSDNIVLATGDGTVRLQHDGTTWVSNTPVQMAGMLLSGATSTITLNGVVGTTGQVLTSAGPGATPTWTTVTVPSQAIAINTQAGNYTVQVSDAFNTMIQMTSPSPNSVVFMNDSSINLPIGAAVLVSQNGIGQTTLLADVGVTILTPTTLTINKQYGKVTVIKTAPNTWEVEGNVSPV
jgi:hypothetical protein